MKILLAHIKIMRPLNLIIGAFAVIITASILKKMDQISVWVTALCVVVFYNAAANAINDYFDQETDKINRPSRPLISGWKFRHCNLSVPLQWVTDRSISPKPK